MCRTTPGTRRAVTTVEVTTGSVGASTAPSRKHSTQSSVGKSSLAPTAISPMVSGIAMISARAGGPQCLPSSSRSTTSPSENSVRISASSIACLTVSDPLSTDTTSTAASPTPAATASTDAFRMLPRNSPESAAAAATQGAEHQQGFGEVEAHRGRADILAGGLV